MNTNEEKVQEAFEERDRELYGRNDIPPVYDLMELPFIGKRYKSRYVQERFEQFSAGWKAGRAALRAESEPVACEHCQGKGAISYMNTPNARWSSSAPCEECGGTGYTAPQTEPKDTGSEI